MWVKNAKLTYVVYQGGLPKGLSRCVEWLVVLWCGRFSSLELLWPRKEQSLTPKEKSRRLQLVAAAHSNPIPSTLTTVTPFSPVYYIYPYTLFNSWLFSFCCTPSRLLTLLPAATSGILDTTFNMLRFTSLHTRQKQSYICQRCISAFNSTPPAATGRRHQSPSSKPFSSTSILVLDSFLL